VSVFTDQAAAPHPDLVLVTLHDGVSACHCNAALDLRRHERVRWLPGCSNEAEAIWNRHVDTGLGHERDSTVLDEVANRHQLATGAARLVAALTPIKLPGGMRWHALRSQPMGGCGDRDGQPDEAEDRRAA
jgi:hypothetical protein